MGHEVFSTIRDAGAERTEQGGSMKMTKIVNSHALILHNAMFPSAF